MATVKELIKMLERPPESVTKAEWLEYEVRAGIQSGDDADVDAVFQIDDVAYNDDPKQAVINIYCES